MARISWAQRRTEVKESKSQGTWPQRHGAAWPGRGLVPKKLSLAFSAVASKKGLDPARQRKRCPLDIEKVGVAGL